MMGLLDWAGFDPMTAKGMQLQGLLGGLTALGAGLAQAGAPRPVGQPWPSVGDAFGAFGQGRQQALQGIYQQQQMGKEQQRQALMAEAQSSRSDSEISEPARILRATLGAFPQGVRGLVPLMDPSQLTGLALQRETSRQRPMTAEELAAAGLPSGTGAFVNDFTGAPNVVRQSQILTPEEERQKLRIAAASRAAPAPVVLGPGQVMVGRDGRIIAQGPEARNPLMSVAPGSTVIDPRSGQPVFQAAPDPEKVAQRTQDTEKALRAEATKLTDNFRTVQDAYNKIIGAGQTGQGDLALLYGYMKLLDPESVVRESEFATAAKSGSLPEQIQGFAMRVIAGERLPESVRQGFIREARNAFAAQSLSYQQNQKIYRDLSARLKVDPANVVLPFETAPPPQGGGGGGGGAVGDPLGLLPRR